MRHDFADGKYTVINDNGVLTALRHKEPWGRDLVGDNLVYWMLVEVDRLKTEIQELKALSVTNILMAVVPGYDGMGQEEYATSVNQVVEKLSELGLAAEDAKGELTTLRTQVEALTVIDHDAWEPCSPGWLMRGGKCADAPRLWHAATGNHWHPKIAALPPEQVAGSAVPEGWFTHDSDQGFLKHATEADAVGYAKQMLKDYRREAKFNDEWPDEVEHLCWGHIVGCPKATEPDENGGVDYVLAAQQPEQDKWARLRARIESWPVNLIHKRIAAKKSGDKSTAQTLKIVLNGTFGKLGSKYSVLYSPDLLANQHTLTGPEFRAELTKIVGEAQKGGEQ